MIHELGEHRETETIVEYRKRVEVDITSKQDVPREEQHPQIELKFRLLTKQTRNSIQNFHNNHLCENHHA